MHRSLLFGAAISFVVLFCAAGTAFADPKDDLTSANKLVAAALAAAQSGDLAGALRQYMTYENQWFDIEDGIRGESRDAYRLIEKYMVNANTALTASDKDGAIKALQALDREQRLFITGQPPGESQSTQPAAADSVQVESSVSGLIALLEQTRSQVKAGDFTAASATWARFEDTWLEVEGEIKTRSSADYRNTENDMARVSTALSKKDGGVTGVLDGMNTRLQPYQALGNYKVFDATIIVLREGLEALLVVVALLAFVRKSGNEDKSSYIWGGAGTGLFVSIALGVAIHVLLGKAFSGSNRELMEGISGLIAAVMLLSVSYWLHSKASLGAWQRYISTSTTKALASGSLIGLGLLSFLAVFREGGETVLFLIGMTGKISTGNLLLGLAIGFVGLAIVGILLTVVGLRIPMRPFFAVASLLTFYLCFKFLGTGLHSLQVADVLPARTATALPSSDTLGLFPTWQTTIPQVILLCIGLVVLVRGRLSDIAVRRARAPVTAAGH